MKTPIVSLDQLDTRPTERYVEKYVAIINNDTGDIEQVYFNLITPFRARQHMRTIQRSLKDRNNTRYTVDTISMFDLERHLEEQTYPCGFFKMYYQHKLPLFNDEE